jgi:ADP-heptose:LPS heptosyltransferase
VYVSEDVEKHVRRIRRLLAFAGIGSERCVFITDRPAESHHWVDRLLRFGTATPAFINAYDSVPHPPDFQRAPRLYVAAQDERDCQEWLHRRRIAGRALILIQPGNKRSARHGHARLDAKEWPKENWAGLLRGIRQWMPEACLLLCGAPGETDMLEAIRISSRCDALIANEDLPLRRLMALMAVAKGMIAVDTGPAHMAAAIGCPVVVLYGNESPQVWGRRSATGQPVIELHDAKGQCASDIPIEHALDAWRSIAAAVPC